MQTTKKLGRKPKISDEQMKLVLLTVAEGQRISDIAKTLDTNASNLSTRLWRLFPEEMQTLKDKKIIATGPRKGQAPRATYERGYIRPELRKCPEELAQLPEVKDILENGMTYIQAAEVSLSRHKGDTTKAVTAPTLNRYVKRVCKHLDIPRPRQRNRQPA